MTQRHKSFKIFLKSAGWTLLGLSLAALGYFGAGYILGG